MRTTLNLVIALMILWFTVLTADAGQLKYIRVGEYESMTRIVFEFESNVNFHGPEIKSPGQIAVDFFDTTMDNPTLQKTRDRARRIEKIEFKQKKTALTANISLISSSFNLKSFYLFTPDRLVLDIYWISTPVASIRTIPPVTGKAPEPVSAGPPENIMQTAVASTVELPPETGMPLKDTKRQVQHMSANSSQLQSYLFIGLMGFFTIATSIALLVIFTLLKKSRRADRSESTVYSKHGSPITDDHLDQESIMMLDSKIQDELNAYGR